MRWFFVFFIVLVLALSVTACTSQESVDENSLDNVSQVDELENMDTELDTAELDQLIEDTEKL